MSLLLSDVEKNDRLTHEAHNALMAFSSQALATCLDNLNNSSLFVHDQDAFPDIYQQFLFSISHRLPDRVQVPTFTSEHAIVLVDEFSRIADLSEHAKVCLALSQATYLDRDSYFEFFGPGKALEINKKQFLSDFNRHLNATADTSQIVKHRNIARAYIDQELVVAYSSNKNMHADVLRHVIETLGTVGQTAAIESYASNVSDATRFELLKASVNGEEKPYEWIAESLFGSPYVTDVLGMGYRPREGDVAHFVRTAYIQKLPDALSILLEHYTQSISLDKLRELLQQLVYPMFESVRSNPVQDPIQQQMQITYEENVHRAMIDYLNLGEPLNPYSLQILGAAMPMIFYRNLDVENFRRALIFLYPKESGVPSTPVKVDHSDPVDGEYEERQKVRDLNNKMSQILEVQSGIQKNFLESKGTPEQLTMKNNMLLMIEGVFRNMAQSLKKQDEGMQP